MMNETRTYQCFEVPPIVSVLTSPLIKDNTVKLLALAQ